VGRQVSHGGQEWEDRWDEWVPFLGLPEEACRAIYTTTVIQGLHRRLKKDIKTRGAFPSDETLLKVPYLAIQDAQKTWGRPSTY
jgi:putative transposase